MAKRNIGTFNCQGILEPSKQRSIVEDFIKYKLSILCVQETHLKGNGILELPKTNNKQLYLYYSGHKNRSIHGVGIIVNSKEKVSFKPISERICQLTILQEKRKKINIFSGYSPTNKTTDDNPEATTQFYNTLTSMIKKTKADKNWGRFQC